MSLTIDANVWLAAADPRESSQEMCARFLALVLGSDEILDSPLLLQVEIAGATARKTGDAGHATRFLDEITRIQAHRWHALDEDLSSRACALAGELMLRGADAVYAAVAAGVGSTLITLDREMHSRAGQHIAVLTPDVWVAAQSSDHLQSMIAQVGQAETPVPPD